MKSMLFLVLILAMGIGQAAGQALRFRLAANSGMVFNEVGAEIISPVTDIMEYPSATGFSPKSKFGADFEIMAPIHSSLDLGVEFEYSNLSGSTETPKLYNYFQFDHVNPLPNSYMYPSESIYYETNLLSILPAARLYLLPQDNKLNLFVRAFAGVSFIGTDLRFVDPFYGIQYNAPYIYTKGTDSSKEPKEITFTGGAGFGGEYMLSDLFSLNLEASAAYTGSDILDGIPDYDYLPNNGIGFQRAEGIGTITGQISVGLIYTFIPDKRMNRSRYTKSKQVTKSKRTWKSSKKHKKRRRR